MDELINIIKENDFEDTFYTAIASKKKYILIPLNFGELEITTEMRSQWEKEAWVAGEEVLYQVEMPNYDILTFSLKFNKIGYMPALQLESDYHC